MPAVFTPNVSAKPSGRWTCAITLLALQVFQPRHSRCCSERYSAVRRTLRLLCAPAGSAAAQRPAATNVKNLIRGMAGRMLLPILFLNETAVLRLPPVALATTIDQAGPNGRENAHRFLAPAGRPEGGGHSVHR